MTQQSKPISPDIENDKNNENIPLNQEGNSDDNPPEHGEQNGTQEKSKPSVFMPLLIASNVLIIIVSFVILPVIISLNSKEIERISSKSAMSYKLAPKFLNNKDRKELVKWHLIKEHSRNPFIQLNDTHLLIEREGFFQISSSLQMITNEPVSNVITMILYHNDEKTYLKESHPPKVNYFSLQMQPIVRGFKKGDTICMEVKPSKYFSLDPDMSDLSIVEL